MKTREVARAVELWAVAVSEADDDIPTLNSYDHPPEEINEAMPLVIAEVQRKTRASSAAGAGASFQQMSYQQTAVKSWEVQLMILISPDDEWLASYTLYDIADALGDALKRDPRMGDRVTFALKDHSVSFDPPEVEYADGTVARAATMTVNIGEQEEV